LAERAGHRPAQKTFSDLAARWRALAESYEFIERTGSFLSKDK